MIQCRRDGESGDEPMHRNRGKPVYRGPHFHTAGCPRSESSRAAVPTVFRTRIFHTSAPCRDHGSDACPADPRPRRGAAPSKPIPVCQTRGVERRYFSPRGARCARPMAGRKGTVLRSPFTASRVWQYSSDPCSCGVGDGYFIIQSDDHVNTPLPPHMRREQGRVNPV